MRETGKPTFVVSDCYWRARLRARGSARSRGSRAVSTHGLNTQRMSAVQKVWSSYVCATILLQHGPAARQIRRRFGEAWTNLMPPPPLATLKFVLRHLGAVAKGAVCSSQQSMVGGVTGAPHVKIGFSVFLFLFLPAVERRAIKWPTE
jgi:hypothetical protein